MSGGACSETDRVSNIESEIQRRARITDMMLTAHSVLRDRNSRRALAFDLTTFGLSTLLVAAAFLDPAVLRGLQVDPENNRLLLGGLSIALFFLSLAGLLVDWKQRATRHQQAVRTLADVKAKCSDLLSGPSDRLEAEGPEFLRGAAFALSEIQPIPDATFVSLKAQHRRKVQISRMLDTHPWALIGVLRLRASIADTWAVLRPSPPRTGEGDR